MRHCMGLPHSHFGSGSNIDSLISSHCEINVVVARCIGQIQPKLPLVTNLDQVHIVAHNNAMQLSRGQWKHAAVEDARATPFH